MLIELFFVVKSVFFIFSYWFIWSFNFQIYKRCTIFCGCTSYIHHIHECLRVHFSFVITVCVLLLSVHLQVNIGQTVCVSLTTLSHGLHKSVCLYCRWRWPFWSTSRHWHYKWRLQTLWTQVRLGWQSPASSPGQLNPRALMSERYWHVYTHTHKI